MDTSGTVHTTIPVVNNETGEKFSVPLNVSKDKVEIGPYSFSRANLIYAIESKPATKD